MADRKLVERVEYVRILIWVIILAIPVTFLTLLFLELYQTGIHFYESLSESLGIPPGIFTIVVGMLGGLLVGLGFRYLGVQHGKWRKVKCPIAGCRGSYSLRWWV
jgi:hypothetical protein